MVPAVPARVQLPRLSLKKMGIDYIDTGAMYRAVGLKVKNNNIDHLDEKSMADMLANTDIDFVNGDIILDGIIVNKEIRANDMSMMASKVSALPAVRAKLVELQRKMGQTKSIIMDGRDMGTNVLTDAEIKIFMTASAEERADRRYKELIEKGQDVTYDQILEDIKQRDHNDMTRALNPLKKADDAIELDTTGMSIDEVTEFILNEVKK